jgi:hypothetical protein
MPGEDQIRLVAYWMFERRMRLREFWGTEEGDWYAALEILAQRLD